MKVLRPSFLILLTGTLLAASACAADSVPKNALTGAEKQQLQLVKRDPPPWPKQVHKFEEKTFLSKKKGALPPEVEKTIEPYPYFDPSVIEWDLNSDKKPELIVSYVDSPGQGKVCHYIYRKEKSQYQLIGKIHHCRIILLEPINGFAQLEAWVSGSEGVFVRALYQMCDNGDYKNTRMDIYRATKFSGDGGPIESSKVYERTDYPNSCK